MRAAILAAIGFAVMILIIASQAVQSQPQTGRDGSYSDQKHEQLYKECPYAAAHSADSDICKKLTPQKPSKNTITPGTVNPSGAKK